MNSYLAREEWEVQNLFPSMKTKKIFQDYEV